MGGECGTHWKEREISKVLVENPKGKRQLGILNAYIKS
jgi:hypothetical protein